MFVCFIKIFLFACVVRLNVALPQINQVKPEVNLDKLTSDVRNAMQKIFTNFEPGQNETKSNKWVFVVIKQIDGDLLEHQIIAKIASINDATMTAELVALADGFHLVIPASEQGVEYEQRVIAVAIIRMLMDLKTMERVDVVMANCSLHSTTSLLFNGTESLALDQIKESHQSGEYIKTLFAHWLQSVVTVLENEPHLNAEFEKRKVEARAVLNNLPNEVTTGLNMPLKGDMATVEEEIAKEIVNSRLFRRMALNRLFLSQSSKHVEMIKSPAGRKQFLLARAIIDLAKHPGQDKKLTKLYDVTLTEVAKIINESDTMDQMQEKLFSQLAKAIEEDEELNNHVKQMENKLDVWITFRVLKNNISLV